MTLLRTSRRLAATVRVVPALAASLALLTGCGSVRTLESPVAVARPSGMPDPFYAARMAALRTAPAAPVAGFACSASMVSPVDGRRLSLVRAGTGYGDYAVSGATSGSAALRLDCLTGAPLGTVRANLSAPRPAMQAARPQTETATGRG